MSFGVFLSRCENSIPLLSNNLLAILASSEIKSLSMKRIFLSFCFIQIEWFLQRKMWFRTRLNLDSFCEEKSQVRYINLWAGYMQTHLNIPNKLQQTFTFQDFCMFFVETRLEKLSNSSHHSLCENGNTFRQWHTAVYEWKKNKQMTELDILLQVRRFTRNNQEKSLVEI